MSSLSDMITTSPDQGLVSHKTVKNNYKFEDYPRDALVDVYTFENRASRDAFSVPVSSNVVIKSATVIDNQREVLSGKEDCLAEAGREYQYKLMMYRKLAHQFHKCMKEEGIPLRDDPFTRDVHDLHDPNMSDEYTYIKKTILYVIYVLRR